MSTPPDLTAVPDDVAMQLVVRQLADVSLEHPGGANVELLAHSVESWHASDVRRLLEEARLQRNGALVDRVHEHTEYWRSRYVVTAAGREALAASDRA
jgi:hypothetical protein